MVHPLGLLTMTANAPTPVLTPTVVPSAPPSSHFQGDWHPVYVGGGWPHNVIDLGLDDIVIAVEQDIDCKRATITAVDLVALQVLWSMAGKSICQMGGDATGFVIVMDGYLTVIDPRTGQVIGQATMPKLDEFLWAGDGYVLTENAEAKTRDRVLCLAPMADPLNCQWWAPHIFLLPQGEMYAISAYVFGDGQWVNTGSGVRMFATGQPAGFGGDAGRILNTIQPSSDEDGSLYPSEHRAFYTGAGERVLRAVPLDGIVRYSFQPWDTATDQAISSPIEASWIGAADEADSYLGFRSSLGYENYDDYDMVTAYDWATGEQLWQALVDGSQEFSPGVFAGGDWITVGSGGVTEARDPITGEIKWHSDPRLSLVGLQHGLLVLSDWFKMEIRDPANGFDLVTTIEQPSDGQVYMTESHYYYIDYEGWLWVLDSQ